MRVPGPVPVVIQAPLGTSCRRSLAVPTSWRTPKSSYNRVPPPPIEIAVGPGAARLPESSRPMPPSGVGLLLVPQFTPSTSPFCAHVSELWTPGEWAVQCYTCAGDYLAYAIPGIQSVNIGIRVSQDAFRSTSVRIEDAKSTRSP